MSGKQATLCLPNREDWASPTPSPRSISSVAPGSWAGSSGVVFMWPGRAPSGIPGRLLRIHFHRDLKPFFVPDPQRQRPLWPEQSSLTSGTTRLVISAKQNTTEKAGVTWQVTAPRYLPFTLTVFQTSEFLIHSSPPPGIHILFKYRNLN